MQQTANLASQSPQRHWFVNVALGERVLRHYHEALDNKTTFTGRVHSKALEIASRNPNTRLEHTALVNGAKGKRLDQMTIEEQAFFVRSLSETFDNPNAPLVLPEGTVIPHLGPTMQWGNMGTVKNALIALQGPSPAAISSAIGAAHKVRSFHNNVYLPGDPRFVTSDTHNVAAGLLIPAGGSHYAVGHNLGRNPKADSGLPRIGPRDDSATGLSGTYAIFHEGIRRAAETRGVIPHEMQSVTWEMIRVLLPDTYRRGVRQENLLAESRQISNNNSQSNAQQLIQKLAGTKKDLRSEGRRPDWIRSR
jgi:hypothetical protein